MRKNILIWPVLLIFVAATWLTFKKQKSDWPSGNSNLTTNQQATGDLCVSYIVNIKKQQLKLYWKDDSAKIFGSIKSLKAWLVAKNQSLIFAMNAGMYKNDQSPQGLFIQEYKTIIPLDSTNGSGNFYLKPNGVFYLTQDSIANICVSADFINTPQIKYATQSGPMLIIDGKIHPAFKAGSVNINIRNGVGILPDGNVIFAMSKTAINLYDFALYFKKLGCKNALYLDGLVSRTYLPQKKWIQEDGNFGVIVAVTDPTDRL